MPHAPTELTQHYVVCGFGRVGHESWWAARAQPARRRDRPDLAALTTPEACIRSRATRRRTPSSPMPAWFERAGSSRPPEATPRTSRSRCPPAHSTRVSASWRAPTNLHGRPSSCGPVQRASSRLTLSGRTGWRCSSSHRCHSLSGRDPDAEQVDLWIEEATIAVGSPLAGSSCNAIPLPPGSPISSPSVAHQRAASPPTPRQICDSPTATR